MHLKLLRVNVSVTNSYNKIELIFYFITCFVDLYEFDLASRIAFAR